MLLPLFFAVYWQGWLKFGNKFRRASTAHKALPSWLVIGFNIVWMIWEVQSQNWTMEAILRALSWLLVVLINTELIVITWRVNSER